jgi:hypothetical protein
MRLMEWCYVVCSHERLRGHRPGELREAIEPIVVPADDLATVTARVGVGGPLTA